MVPMNTLKEYHQPPYLSVKEAEDCGDQKTL